MLDWRGFLDPLTYPKPQQKAQVGKMDLRENKIQKPHPEIFGKFKFTLVTPSQACHQQIEIRKNTEEDQTKTKNEPIPFENSCFVIPAGQKHDLSTSIAAVILILQLNMTTARRWRVR
jgi:hypothetical protein